MKLTLGPIQEQSWGPDSLDPSLDRHGYFWWLWDFQSKLDGEPYPIKAGIAFVCPMSIEQGDIELTHRHYFWFPKDNGSWILFNFKDKLDNTDVIDYSDDECKFIGKIENKEWRIVNGSN